MHNSIFGMSIGIVFGISFILFASAQTPDDSKISFIYAESIVKNSDGKMVSYQETSRIKIVDTERLNEILDYEVNFGKKDVIETKIDGIPHQWIKFSRLTMFDDETVRATTALGDVVNGTTKIATIFTHDGYAIDKGDELNIIWIVARSMK